MADNWIESFAVALGFDVDTASLNTAKKSIADYEAAVKAAEKRIEDARWAGAKTEEEIAKLTREANLKEARAALATAQEREKAEKETARKREERNKEFMAGMGRLALAATAAATAISYAVNRVTQAFDNLGFVSARTGASVRSLNSLGYAFKQVGGSSQQAVSAVEKFAQALRTNDGLKAYVQSLGVDTTKDTADQLLDTVDALSKHEYQVGSREAGMLGISEEDYKLLTQYAAKVKEYRAEYDATTKALGVDSKEAADSSMAFQRSLNRLQATASALADKLMVSLAPALQQIVDRFQAWIRSNPGKVEHIMDGISKALVWVTEKIAAMVESIAGNNGDEFIKRWDAFSASVDRFSTSLERLIKLGAEAANSPLYRILKLLTVDNPLATWPSRLLLSSAEASPGVMGTPGARPGPVQDNRSWYERNAPTFMGGKPDPNAPTDTRGGLRARAARAMRGDQSGGVAANPGAYKDVLDHIARSEGTAKAPSGGYNTSLGYGRYLPGGQEQTLTTKTLDEILALGNHMRRQPGNPNSSAMGRYQIVGDTLRDQMRKLGLKGTDLFDEKMQDRIGANLARQRGASSVGLRNEWASLVGANNRIAVELMQKVDPRASTMPLERQPSPGAVERAAQSSIHLTAPKIEVKGGENGSGAAPEIHIPGVPKMMQMPGFNPGDYMKPAPEASSSVVNSGGNTTKTVTQTFHNKTTITGAENPKQAAGIMENAFGRMHDLALENIQSATV